MTDLTDREKEMLEALKTARKYISHSVADGSPILSLMDAAIAKAEPPKPPAVNMTWDMLQNRSHPRECICAQCEGIRDGSIRIVPDEPKSKSAKPRRWVVEESSAVSERTGDGPHGQLDVGGKKIPACVIREVEPITREQIRASQISLGGVQMPHYGLMAEFLRELGIEVEP